MKALVVYSSKTGNTKAIAETAAEDIIKYNLKKSGAGSIQQWLDGGLSDTAGSSEGYVTVLKKYAPTLDYSGCADAFAARGGNASLPPQAPENHICSVS